MLEITVGHQALSDQITVCQDNSDFEVQTKEDVKLNVVKHQQFSMHVLYSYLVMVILPFV